MLKAVFSVLNQLPLILLKKNPFKNLGENVS